jgi:hypothetical protein
MDASIRDAFLSAGAFSAIIALLIWLNKDSQRKIDVLSARADARQGEITTHYEKRISEVVERSENRIASITDQFVKELQGNRDAAIQRRIEDQEMHQGYQEVIREQTQAIEKQGQAVETLASEVRQLALKQHSLCRAPRAKKS